MSHMTKTPVDWAARARDLVEAAEINAPMVDQALSWLAGQVPGARLVLDVGSGPGVAAGALAQLLPEAEVLATDGAEPLLALARERADRLGVGKRFTTRQVTLPDGLADLPPADLIWVSGVAHHLTDPESAVAGLATLVRPGGLLALREGGMPQRFLPGYADGGLTARLNVVNDEMSHRHEHPMGARDAERSWPSMLRAAGLTVTSRTFLLDLPEPLGPAPRRQLQRGLRLSADYYGGRLSAADRDRLAELSADDGPESVLARDDVFLLRAATVHVGRREP
jgi:SAM-dependent methyltransferase